MDFPWSTQVVLKSEGLIIVIVGIFTIDVRTHASLLPLDIAYHVSWFILNIVFMHQEETVLNNNLIW